MEHHWIAQRKQLESSRKSHLHGKINYSLFAKISLWLLKMVFRIKSLKQTCQELAGRLKVNSHELYFPELPHIFDGFKILHMTDFHLDLNPYLATTIRDKIQKLNYDIVLLTGDYQDSYQLDSQKIMPYLKTIMASIKPHTPIYATLGNHDNTGTVKTLRQLGVKVLINQSIKILKGMESITLVGLDDIHSFFTPSSLTTLSHINPSHFSILAVHSPEIFAQASESNVNLYLCGHTHGGQICLPNGTPLITHAKSPIHMAKGHWEFQGMKGYTNAGVGTSGIPLRVFCPGELVLLTLKHQKLT